MYQAGIYCRISIKETAVSEDEWKDSCEQIEDRMPQYSNSICNQIQMAKDYIAGEKDITVAKIYADDGASGSDFNRTEFRRMLADIEMGIINMVIVKDISRLGREHIDTSFYLGKYFPEKLIRVVSILDHYDSAVSTYTEMLGIKTLLNDMYIKDLSKKIKMTIQMKRRKGEYTPKEPPFGYIKSKAIHNRLEVDAYAAEVVGRIYKMYLNGHGCAAISRILNEEKLPPPAKYKKEVLKSGYVWNVGKGLWTAATVGGILKNPVYIGAGAVRKSEKPSHKLSYRKSIPLEKLELILDVHEAIISKEEFEQVQKIRRKRRVVYFDRKREPHKYAGLIFCGGCKTAMSKRYLTSHRNYDGYVCGFHQRMGKNHCELNYISFETLDKLVAFSINQQIKQAESVLETMEIQVGGRKTESGRRMRQLKNRIHSNEELKRKAYEQFLEDTFTKEQYLELKKMYDNKNKKYEKEIQELKEKKQRQTTLARDREQWIYDLIKGNIMPNHLSKEVLQAFVERIYVYPDKKIAISLKFAFDNTFMTDK